MSDDTTATASVAATTTATTTTATTPATTSASPAASPAVSTPAASTATAPAAAVHNYPLSLKEFCARLSRSDRRVELIAAFYQSAVVAGHRVDTAANFHTAFAAFAVKPV